MATAAKAPPKLTRKGHLKWQRLGDLVASPIAQRHKLNTGRVDHIRAELDLEQLGTPTVNERSGHVYIIDGWHRVEALRLFGFDPDDVIQCWTYVGLSEQEEADTFLKLNDTLAVDAMSRFRVGVNAGRPVECDIDRIVRAQGLVVTSDRIDGAIRAVGTLVRIYRRTDGATLGRTLRIVRDAYGTAGMESVVLDGIGLLCGRYNGELEDQLAVAKLARVHGGVHGLLGKAELIRRQTGNPKGQCVAAAAVDLINAGRGGHKLTSWWREVAS